MKQALVKTHRCLAIGLGFFLMSHLIIHLSALGGAEMHLGLLSSTQGIYRNWFIEPLLLIGIFLQIFIGIKLVLRRWRYPNKGFWGWTQIISGFYLAGFLLIHSSAALFSRHIAGLDTNFYWAAGTLNVGLLKVVFAPYYFLGVLSLFAHLGAALYFGWPKHGKLISKICLGIGILIGGLIVLTFSGAFYSINLPPEYVEYFEKFGL